MSSVATREYWKEAVAQALDEQDMDWTDSELAEIASHIEDSHELFSMAFPSPSGNPRDEEIIRLERELEIERSKVWCSECSGRGQLLGDCMDCWKCNGEGKVLP